MQNNLRFAFIGKMRSGKDTAADYLVSKYGGKVIKFADPLYELESLIYKYIDYPIPADKTLRRGLLQYLGTDFGRKIVDENLWAKLMERRLLNMQGLEKLYTTDVRFSNEALLMKDYGFKLIRVWRPEIQRIEAGATNLTHASETSLDDFAADYLISNIGTLEEFHQKIDKMVMELV